MLGKSSACANSVYHAEGLGINEARGSPDPFLLEGGVWVETSAYLKNGRASQAVLSVSLAVLSLFFQWLFQNIAQQARLPYYLNNLSEESLCRPRQDS